MTGTTDYRTTFARWHERSSVRSRPAREHRPTDPGTVYFPPELVPAAGHDLLRQRDPAVADRLLTQRLYEYLSFTVELEETAVVPVTSRIGRGRATVELPAGMRADAFKITTDEAYHSLMTYELIEGVARETGVAPLLPDSPPFLAELAAVRGADPLAPLVAAVVSETLVSRILADLPNDERLPAAVRDVVRDHAEDEGRHHAYFRALLRELWPRLGDTQQRRLGVLVPRLVHGFLAPDLPHLRRLLDSVGLPAAEVDTVLDEAYAPERVAAEVAHAARRTVGYFAEVGALEHGSVADAFGRAGLVP